jgi:hypothetical protein
VIIDAAPPTLRLAAGVFDKQERHQIGQCTLCRNR